MRLVTSSASPAESRNQPLRVGAAAPPCSRLSGPGGGRLCLLEFVEDEQQPARREVCREVGRILQPESGRDAFLEQLGVGERREVSEVHAVVESRCNPACALDRQGCLSRAAGPGERDETSAAFEVRQDVRELGLPTQERRRRSRKMPTRSDLCGLDQKRLVLSEDRAFEVMESVARIEPELVEEGASRPLVCVERI